MAIPLLAAAALAPMAGGIVGNLLGAGDRADAKDLSNRALAEILGVQTPDVEKMKLSLTPYQIQGLLNSISEQAEQVAPSAMETISTDPRLATAQMQALKKIQEVGNLGLTPAEQVQAEEMQREAQSQEAVRQASILRNMAERGVSGSGVEAAARLASSQNMANQVAESSDKLRAEAFNRALEATSKAGQLGGSMRSQEFNEKDRVASAKDAIASFNAQQRTGAQSRNVAAQRAIESANLAAKQRIADANTGMANEQQRFNTQLAQQDFNNKMARAGAASGAYSNAAGQRQGQANATGQMWSGIGSAAGSAAGAVAARDWQAEQNDLDRASTSQRYNDWSPSKNRGVVG